jgi:tetratricopeptide (TPR) repeat protein
VMQQDGQWQLKAQVELGGLALDIPDSIQKLILSRLDRLPEAPKLTLKVSSVIGQLIDLALVSHIHPEGREVAELEVQAELMEVEEVIRGETTHKLYAFRHQTTQEVAYETLLFAQRRQLHEAVAITLAEQAPEASGQIAHHAFLGEAWPLALRYNILAGQQARRLYANQQGVDFFQKALRSAEALPEAETIEARKQSHLALGELLVSTGKYEDAKRHLEAGIALAKAQGDREAEARGYRWLGRSHELRGEFPLALRWLEEGFTVLGDTASLEGAEIALIAGLINIRQGQFDTAQHYCERSLGIAQILNDAAVRARTYNLLGIDDLRRGNSGAALERFAQALAQYEALENVYGQATSHNLLANGYFQRDEWSLADKHYRRSLELFLQIGDAYNQVLVNNNLGGIAIKQERPEAALGYYQRALRLLGQIGGSLWVLGALYMNSGHALLRLKQLEQADQELRTALAYFEQSQQRDFLAELYGLLAEAAWLKGDLATANAQGQQSLAIARELEMPREEGHALRILGEIARAEGALAQADSSFSESYRILVAAGDEYESAKVRLAHARLYEAQGLSAQALAALDDSEPIVRRLAIQPDLESIAQMRERLSGL